jgi:hypothetical protein
MSVMDQKWTFLNVQPMSALGQKQTLRSVNANVRFVPKADQVRCSKKGSFLAAVSTMVAIRAFPDSI